MRGDVDWLLATIIGALGAATAFAFTSAAVNRLLDPNVLLLMFEPIVALAGV